MRKILIIMIAATLAATGCKGNKEEFKSADGAVSAVHQGSKWLITDADGREVVEGYDSMRVAEVGESGHPMTVYYYKNGRQTVVQYYTTMALRCKGDIVDGQRDGLWQYYYENGNLQTEATYADGREDGEYRVYRENGVPYYIGYYAKGVRTGVWEVYDQEGNLVEKREY